MYDTSFLPDTAIRLGQLIVDPRKPSECLQDAPLEIESQVDVQTEYDFQYQKRTDGKFHLGFSAAVLSLLPFGLAGSTQKGTTHKFEIEKIDSQKFKPTHKYTRQSVFQPEVLKYLAKHKYRKSLFMIVGIKVGFNAKIIHQRKSEKGGQLDGAVPGALVGIPVDLGAKFKHTTMDDRYERKSIPSSFVFAYRLREVRYFKKDDFIKDMEFVKGAELHGLYGNIRLSAQPSTKEVTYIGTEDEIDVDGIVGEDFEDDETDTIAVEGCFMISPPLC